MDSTTEYLDHALAPNQSAAFEAHLVSCVNCQTYFGQMNQLIRAAPALRFDPGEGEAPQHLYELLVEKTAAASVERQPRRLSYKPLLIAAVVVVVILTGLWLYRSRHSGSLPNTALTIDLTQWPHLRGIEQPSHPPILLLRKKLDLTLDLPIGAEPGEYQVGVASSKSEPFIITTARATLIDHVATLRVKLNLTKLHAGTYRLAVRPVSWDWAYYPLRIK